MTLFQYKYNNTVYFRFFGPVLIVSEVSFLVRLIVDLMLVPVKGYFYPLTTSFFILLFGAALFCRHRMTDRQKEFVLILLCTAIVFTGVVAPPDSILLEIHSSVIWLSRAVMSINFFIIAVFGIVKLYGDKHSSLTTSRVTGLGNRRWLSEKVDNRIASAVPRGTLILIDVGNFRIINSIFGRPFGDELIRLFARMLTPEDEATYLIAHLGGIEFCIWAEHTDRDFIRRRFGGFESQLRQRLSSAGEAVNVMLKSSAAEYPGDGRSFSELLASANIALEQAMLSHQLSCVYFRPGMKADLRTESVYLYELRRAVENRDFYICYQQKRSLDGGHVYGLEALARWHSDVLGEISPAVFVPLIHKAGMTDRFTEIILGKVLDEMKQIDLEYGSSVKIAVNIPASTFSNPFFIEETSGLVSTRSISPDRITFEITEDIFINDFDTVSRIITRLNELGISLSLDDFGTGYSSLSYLCKLPVQEVKIDKVFIDEIDKDERSFTLVKAICDIAKSNNYTVVAEGVETAEQLNLLQRTSCDLVQGYIYSRPEQLRSGVAG